MKEIFVIDLLKQQLVIKDDLGENISINFIGFNWLNPNTTPLKGSILQGTPFFRCLVDDVEFIGIISDEKSYFVKANTIL